MALTLPLASTPIRGLDPSTGGAFRVILRVDIPPVPPRVRIFLDTFAEPRPFAEPVYDSTFIATSYKGQSNIFIPAFSHSSKCLEMLTVPLCLWLLVLLGTLKYCLKLPLPVSMGWLIRSAIQKS